ncbi:unnamed protein product [Cylindrotheca closterium]|uniref:RNA polymerase sigma-70 domain-containing protein n=1 Tax=Cylindrotheca closterium TaxID=2856 RepID=A0AAD2G4C8_9STRA|nr:unnamed protein product [Cylindrotheca closterium]
MKRCIRVASLTSVALLSTNCNAMLTPTTTREKKLAPLPRTVSDILPKSSERSRLEETYFESDDDLGFEVNAFQELQNSVSSEILDEVLQTQIDQASKYPERFLDAHMKDATFMEKVAMSSIPEQLPGPAVKALNNNNNRQEEQQQSEQPKSNRNFYAQAGLKYSLAKVTPEEEKELGKMIQKGVKLHKIRAAFEEEHDRKPTKAEWSKAAGLSSAKALRMEVANYRRAKQLLVSANIGLVHAVIRPQYQSLKQQAGLTYDEFIQEGSLGLIRAAELFDPERGLRFSTYATIWIKGALSNSHIQEQITVPLRERAKFNKIRKAQEELTALNDAEPTIEEVANHLGMSISEVVETNRRFKSAQQVLSLDYQTTSQSRSGVESSTYNRLENDKNFRADADLAERTQFQADVVAAMAANLNAREARLLRLRYGLAGGHARTLRECAEAMGISQTYAQNINKTCLKKLREAAEADSLLEYFLTIA